jgi:hypothetical protein
MLRGASSGLGVTSSGFGCGISTGWSLGLGLRRRVGGERVRCRFEGVCNTELGCFFLDKRSNIRMTLTHGSSTARNACERGQLCL